MEFLSGPAPVLLTLAGYSSGAVIGGRSREVAPGLLDLGAVAVEFPLRKRQPVSGASLPG